MIFALDMILATLDMYGMKLVFFSGFLVERKLGKGDVETFYRGRCVAEASTSLLTVG